MGGHLRLLFCLSLLLALVMTAAAADVTGKWSGTYAITGPDGAAGAPNNAFMVLKQSGTAVTGTGGSDEYQQYPIQNGKIDGNKLTAELVAPDGATYSITATIDGDRLSGDLVVAQGGQSIMGKIDLKRMQ